MNLFFQIHYFHVRALAYRLLVVLDDIHESFGDTKWLLKIIFTGNCLGLELMILLENRLKEVLCLGVTAGAYILTLFAVSW